jgi:hypothetical protein
VDQSDDYDVLAKPSQITAKHTVGLDHDIDILVGYGRQQGVPLRNMPTYRYLSVSAVLSQ